MKRRLAAILSAVLAALVTAGCGMGIKQQNDSLTVWLTDPYIKGMFSRAFEDFKATHPGVSLRFAEMPEPVAYNGNHMAEYQTYLNETLPQYDRQMRDEILTGKGPDVILFSQDTFPDLHKTIAAGAFCDLAPFVEADETYLFDADGERGSFRENIIDAGVIQGKRLFVPLFYNFPGLTASEKTLSRYGVRLTDSTTYLELLEELTKVQSDPLPLECRGNQPVGKHTELSGAVELDFEKRTVSINEERLRRLVEANKLLLELPVFQTNDNAWGRLEAGRALLYQDERADAFFDVSAMINAYDEPQPTPYRDAEGGIRACLVLAGAVNNASANQQNAYDFLKLCLQYPAQTMPSGTSGIPVNLFNYERWLESQKKRNETAVMDEYVLANRRQLPDELYERLGQWIDGITEINVEYGLDERIERHFSPYYGGEQSYGACRDALKNELEIYISE